MRHSESNSPNAIAAAVEPHASMLKGGVGRDPSAHLKTAGLEKQIIAMEKNVISQQVER